MVFLSLVVHTHHVSAIYSYHQWTNIKPYRKKLLSFICYDVYQCIVVLSILCILCLEDRESSVTPIEVCQDWNPTVTVARQDFRKCCLRPHALGYGILVCSLCMTCMVTATSSFGCVAEHSAARGVIIQTLCEKLFIEFMVCFSLLRCDLQEFFFMGLMVLVSF
jgi:hypothetical protein